MGAEIAFLAAQGYAATGTNRGISGTSTADWLPTGANLPAAIAAFQTANVTVVQVMLGTNDARTPNSFTALQHAANMQAIVGALRGAGFSVVLHLPLWTVPNSGSSGAQWPADPNTMYRQYFEADIAMADGLAVFIGDTGNFVQTQLAPGSLLAVDGIHPADSAANTAIGQYWALGVLNRYAPTTFRWTHL